MSLTPASSWPIRFCLLYLAALLSVALAAKAQTPTVAGVQVSGVGLAKTVRINPAELAKLPRRQVARPDHGGKPRTYSGVALYDVLTAVGAELGSKLPGKGMAHYLLASAADGYHAVFALAELDPGFATHTIVLADRCDGQPRPATAGPYQIIVPDEKKMGR
ncbi:hypothetical protein [Hymenobacter terrenus]|uniref:hypothetical protein n=1 Tax=Hymenobacter terrenus TaxID=1629124 RepID=UPI0006961AD4|nr:hypothetical protein [Hymenobacter terrenus]